MSAAGVCVGTERLKPFPEPPRRAFGDGDGSDTRVTGEPEQHQLCRYAFPPLSLCYNYEVDLEVPVDQVALEVVQVFFRVDPVGEQKSDGCL